MRPRITGVTTTERTAVLDIVGPDGEEISIVVLLEVMEKTDKGFWSPIPALRISTMAREPDGTEPIEHDILWSEFRANPCDRCATGEAAEPGGICSDCQGG